MADDDQTSNVTDETILLHVDLAVAAGRELKLAQEDQKLAAAVHRNVFKTAKAAGVNTRILKEMIALRQVDSAEREMDDRDRERYRKLMGMTIGTQFVMDVAPQPAAAATEGDEFAMSMARDDGFKAGRAGADRVTTNQFVPGTGLHVVFDTGWVKGQASIADTLAAPKGKGKKSTPVAEATA